MENAFEAKLIEEDTLPLAHAVLQLSRPDLTLRECRTLRARSRSSGSQTLGLMGLFDRRGYIHAVFVSGKDRAPGGGCRLAVRDFVVSDMIAFSMLSLMIGALETLGRREGCDQMTIDTLPEREDSGLPLQKALVSRGFSACGISLMRTLQPDIRAL